MYIIWTIWGPVDGSVDGSLASVKREKARCYIWKRHQNRKLVIISRSFNNNNNNKNKVTKITNSTIVRRVTEWER